MKLNSSTELRDILQEKNDLIIRQTRRIRLLEDKLTEIREKYIHLKGAMNMIK
jgi:hypothetical protein